MPSNEKPRNLQDVSHLFLSGGRSRVKRPAQVEAVLWLVSIGPGGNRAFLAAGCAAAAAARGVHVTLIEIGRGLPNVGYYLALEPKVYAAVSVDPSHLLTGSAGPRLRYASSAGIDPLDRYDPFDDEPVSPSLTIVAFDYAVGRWIAVKGANHRLPARGGRPDALCCFGGPDDRIEREEALRDLRREYPEAFMLDLAEHPVAERGGTADETFAVPAHLASSWPRRLLPEDPFFDDIVSTLLQVLSYRRRRTEGHATG
jgi:hypothetical protein